MAATALSTSRRWSIRCELDGISPHCSGGKEVVGLDFCSHSRTMRPRVFALGFRLIREQEVHVATCWIGVARPASGVFVSCGRGSISVLGVSL